MSVFVDTSALMAVLNANDLNHSRATSAWQQLIESEEALVTTNYVVVELFALVQRRFGLDAVRALESNVLPVLDVVWIDARVHQRAVAAVLAAGLRNLSLVDCASFEIMHDQGIRTVFTFDGDFAAQGFEIVP